MVTPNQPSNRRFMGNSIHFDSRRSACARVCLPGTYVRRRILARSTGEISLSLVENKYLFLLQT